MYIRSEKSGDEPAIRAVIQQAFARDAEANLVDQLRQNRKSVLAFVAVAAEKIIGYILFTRAELGAVNMVGLAPLAVLPEWQRRGVGMRLMQTGIEACRSAGFEAIIVLGHPEYYPRFGFVPARKFGFQSEYNVHDDVFMALELQSGAFKNCEGVARYQPEFNDV